MPVEYTEQIDTIIGLLEEIAELLSYSNSIGLSIYAWIVFAIVVASCGYIAYLILKPILYFLYKF